MPKPEKHLMTVPEYARHRGCTAPAVRKAIATGRITAVDGKIDPAKADAEWKANTRPQARRTTSRLRDLPADYHGARARREAAEARLAELKVLEAEGQVVNTDKVVARWAGLVGNAKARFLGLGPALAPVLHGAKSVAEVEGLLTGAVHQVLAELSGDGLP